MNNENIMNPSKMVKISHAISFLAYSIKEIYEYLTMKTSQGKDIYPWRVKYNFLERLLNENDRVTILLAKF